MEKLHLNSSRKINGFLEVQAVDKCGLCHMGLHEEESLSMIKRETDQTGVEEQNNYVVEEDVIEEIHRIIFVCKKRLCLIIEENGSHIEYRLK